MTGASRCATTDSIRTARYRVRVVYAGDVYSFTRKLRLDADGSTEVHGWITKEGHPKPVEYRRAGGGDGGWRADAHLAGGARRGRRGTREPDRRSVAAARAVARDPVTTPDADARWENPVRRKLRNGEPVFGVTLTTPSLDVAARAAALGFDFLWIELEHSPITLETARHIVLATRGLGAMPVARLPVNELWTAKHALDMGMAGVIFPFTSTAALAQQAVEACQYPPAGRRGSGAGLATSSWPEPLRYYDSADANVLIVAIIEEARALDEIEAIAATPRLDALFIGTSDLSFSMGFRGRQDEPRLRQAIDRIKDAARRHGKALGRPVGDAAQARQFIDEGFTLFQAASDLGFFERGVRELLEPLGRLRAPGDRPLY